MPGLREEAKKTQGTRTDLQLGASSGTKLSKEKSRDKAAAKVGVGRETIRKMEKVADERPDLHR